LDELSFSLTFNVAYLCANVESDYNITAAQLTTWNTWLASNCDSQLYAGMTAASIRPVCIGVNGTNATTTTTTKTSSSVSMGPTATGEVAGCLQYYTVQSGDSCSSIDTAFSISFAQLYQWNPSSTSLFSLFLFLLLCHHTLGCFPCLGNEYLS
jgi:LysM repeat protein